MHGMSTRNADYREIIDRLPEGAVLVLQDITWDAYEQLLEDLADRPGVRVTYDEGRVEIVSPSRKHEKYKEFIGDLVKSVADELDISIESSGAATWKNKKDQKATEADLCFHIANAERVIGKDELDLTVDPPPDLAVEVDVTNQSLSKFPVYAVLGVREIWRYIEKRQSVAMYALRGSVYEEIQASMSFPMLKPEILGRFMELSRTEGQKKALTAFRQWLKSDEAVR
jgi:Uma2 family endonuclease